MIATVFIFSEPGVTLIRINLYFGSLSLTDAGLLLLTKLLIKSLIMVTYSFVLVMTTKYSQLVYIAKKLLPSPINTMFLLTYRFSFVMFENLSTMVIAIGSRSGALIKGFMGKSRLYGAIFAASIIHSIEKAERVGMAMEARGFKGELPVYQTALPPSNAGIAFIALTISLYVISILGGLTV
jgi:cobalt/nickel transport system permease protein